jgi:hypothetical protein
MHRFVILFKKLLRLHFFESLIISLIISWVISIQISDRTHFANTELYQDVMERWGAPISQPAPSVRYVQTGSIFTDLKKLPLSSQKVIIDAVMNYRKRGLTYFSGFDFKFLGTYAIENNEQNDMDLVFVFPIDLQKTKVLLSELSFFVNNELTNIGLSENADKLVWTGRLAPQNTLTFKIEYKGRGLDQFVYALDPALPVKNFSLISNIQGGSNFDYAPGVIPATEIKQHDKNKISLTWDYKSLESGVPVGLILPSEKSFSMLIATMTGRSWACFVLFFMAIGTLALYARKRLKFYESYLLSASFSFFFILLAYLAAFMNFYLAYLLSLMTISSLLYFYIRHLLASATSGYIALILLFLFLFVPTLAVILQGYTGLIYTLEILVVLGMLMKLSTQKFFQSLMDELFVIS